MIELAPSNVNEEFQVLAAGQSWDLTAWVVSEVVMLGASVANRAIWVVV